MEKAEFESRVDTINMIRNQAAPLKKEMLEQINNTFTSNVSTLVSLLNERDKLFNDYLQSLKDFNYDDGITTPSELFKGIRTVSDEADPEELKKKTEQMKNNAIAIESKNKQIESISNHTISTLKKSIGTLAEMMIQENQIYDMSVDLLSSLDSIYDIGKIASSTK